MELLLITEGENKHYVFIKDVYKFMYNQTKHEHRKDFCMYYLQCFSSSDNMLKNNQENCLVYNGQQAIKMPEKGDNMLKFNNVQKQLPVPFVIYADFEAITEKNTRMPANQTMMNHILNHIKNIKSVDINGYKVVCCNDDEYSKPVQIYKGENDVYKFIERTLNKVKWRQKTI